MKKKHMLITALLTAAALLAVCPRTAVYASDAEESLESVPQLEQTAGTDEYSWQDIQDMNQGERMIYMADSNGYLTFLGNKYCEDIVTNEEEARQSLEHIHNLLGLDGIDLTYYKSDKSPITGNTYYTFFQTTKGVINGEVITARYYSSLVKVIADSEGHVCGVSADLNHNMVSDTSDEEFVTKEEAEAVIKEMLDKDLKIYSDYTEVVYWTDEGTAYGISDGKTVPAYVIYADASQSSGRNTSKKPYMVYIVSASYSSDGDQPIRVLQQFYTDTLSIDEYDDVYTSLFYFDGMEDVGNYTYTVDLSWIKDVFEPYEGDLTREVTVPVMRDTETGLYYLGSKEKLIACTNAYDFDYYETLNSYVSENPEDLNSWHFYDTGKEDDGIEEYFHDPNYVLPAFEVYVEVADEFEDRYGLPSVTDEDIPLLLEVYQTSGSYYPDEITDFNFNASNKGQILDWAVMSVSPALAECLNPVVMGHEYTHGINGQLTSTQYLNDAGALMESYADIIGMQIAMLNGYIEEENYWKLSGTYYYQMRSMSDPLEFNQPKYRKGVYYIPPIDSTLWAQLDNGGVHQNSGICNYLAYCLVAGEGEVPDEYLLSVDNNLDMWFETLYMATHVTGYYDQGQYLEFAAKCMGLSEENQEYLLQLLIAFGLEADENGEIGVRMSEDYRTITFDVEVEDEYYADMYDLGFQLRDENGTYVLAAGDAYPGQSLTIKVGEDDSLVPWVVIGDIQNGYALGGLKLNSGICDEYHIVMKTVLCEKGKRYNLNFSEYPNFTTNFESEFDEHIFRNDEGNPVFYTEEEGEYFISFYDESSGECLLLELCVEDDEDE